MIANISQNKLIISDESMSGKVENKYTFEKDEFWRVSMFWASNWSFNIEILQFINY